MALRKCAKHGIVITHEGSKGFLCGWLLTADTSYVHQYHTYSLKRKNCNTYIFIYTYCGCALVVSVVNVLFASFYLGKLIYTNIYRG